jgi:hypothetical protein
MSAQNFTDSHLKTTLYLRLSPGSPGSPGALVAQWLALLISDLEGPGSNPG